MPPTTALDLKRTLRDAGLRATAARALVLSCLMEAEGPLTHAEVSEQLVDHGYDRATLYRNLMDLTNVGLVNRADHGDHLWRFEVADDDDHEINAHPHFVCVECGDVSCLPDDTFSLKLRRGAPKALRERNVEIHIRGVCNTCA